MNFYLHKLKIKVLFLEHSILPNVSPLETCLDLTFKGLTGVETSFSLRIKMDCGDMP